MSDAKVIRLPTAARRKVQQPRHEVRRALAGHLAFSASICASPVFMSPSAKRAAARRGLR